jgi:hypothetical protein
MMAKALKSAALPLIVVASLSAQSTYDKLLTSSDVEKATGLKGVKTVLPGSQPGAGGHLNFAGPDGKLLLMVNFGDAQLYKKAREQKEMTIGGQKFPMPLFARSVAGIGDEAFAAPPGPDQNVLYARRGNQAVSVTTYFGPPGSKGVKPVLPMAQLEEIARLIFSRW